MTEYSVVIGNKSTVEGNSSIAICGKVIANDANAIGGITDRDNSIVIGSNASKVEIGSNTTIGTTHTTDIIINGQNIRDICTRFGIIDNKIDELESIIIGNSCHSKIVIGHECDSPSNISIGGINFDYLLQSIEILNKKIIQIEENLYLFNKKK